MTRPAASRGRPRASRPREAANGAAADGANRVAAIDIGSNSIRQIVADVSPDGQIRVLDEMKAAPRLGAGLDQTGELDAAAMERAVEAIARMATLARSLQAGHIEIVATSAVRDAANAETFAELVRNATGLELRLLSGDEEARLSFRSALAHFELGAGRAVVMDIGGGSLELSLSADGLLERLESFPLGAIRMTERFLGVTPRRRSVADLRRHVRRTLRRKLPFRQWRGAITIGSGGTFTNLAGIFLERQGMRTAQSVHGTTIPRVEVEHILEMLQEMTPAERLAVPGLNPGRGDIIVAGVAVAAEVLERFEAGSLVVSRFGIREGLLLESARVEPVVADPGEARARSVREFAERSHFEEPHAIQVQRLALQLFDAIGPRLDLDATDRRILADAALLHDVGYHISYEKHHKHSYHLILHADFLGMSPEEQVAVANVARYHRGAKPKKRHRNFRGLDPAMRRRIRALSAILRVTDGLDRGHVGAVDRVKVRWLERAIRITPVATDAAAAGPNALRLELWGARRKAELLEEVAGIPVELVGHGGTVVEADAP